MSCSSFERDGIETSAPKQEHTSLDALRLPTSA